MSWVEDELPAAQANIEELERRIAALADRMDSFDQEWDVAEQRIAALEELYQPAFKVGDRIIGEQGFRGVITHVNQPVTYNYRTDSGCLVYGRDRTVLKPDPAPEPLAPLKERIEKVLYDWERGGEPGTLVPKIMAELERGE